MKPLFYYFGRGRIITKISPPFHTVDMIDKDGKHSGTLLIMTEGEIENNIRILIKKGLVEKGLKKKVTGKFLRFNKDFPNSRSPITWNFVIGAGYKLDYSRYTITMKENVDNEIMETLLSLANGELRVPLYEYMEKKKEIGKMILP